MLPISTASNRSFFTCNTPDPAAAIPMDKGAIGPYFGILPTEVIARILVRLPVESRVHSAITSRVCSGFSGLSTSHRFAASLYAEADLGRGQPGATEPVARVDKTLADLALHADSIEDKYKVAILNRLVEQMNFVPVHAHIKVWRQLLDARSCLFKADEAEYVLNCLRSPEFSNQRFQPAELLTCFGALVSTISKAPADAVISLLNQCEPMLHDMSACIQQQAFVQLFVACEKLDDAIRLPSLLEAIGKIFWLKESNHPGAVDVVLRTLPRLRPDEAAPLLNTLLGPSAGLSTQQKARCLDAGILLFNHLVGSSKRAVLNELARCANRLPEEMNERYYPTLMACHRSLPT
jgi:hypothetical protein